MRGLSGRVLVVAAAIATAGALAAIAFAPPAVAAKKTAPVACGKVQAPGPKHGKTKNARLSGCSGAKKATGGKGVIGTLATAPGSYTATVKWNKKGSTTNISYTVAAESNPDEHEKSDCPKHTTESVLSGSVTGGTGAAATAIPAGSPVAAELCTSSKGVTNEPGTRFTF
jgi:hypothetical protein